MIVMTVTQTLSRPWRLTCWGKLSAVRWPLYKGCSVLPASRTALGPKDPAPEVEIKTLSGTVVSPRL